MQPDEATIMALNKCSSSTDILVWVIQLVTAAFSKPMKSGPQSTCTLINFRIHSP